MKVQQIITWEMPRKSLDDATGMIFEEFKDANPSSGVRIVSSDITIIDTEEQK